MKPKRDYIVILPSFELLKRQPDLPHVAHVVAKRGALITYVVHRSRKGNDWWISASLDGMRMSNTLHTSMPTRAAAWIAAVETGQIQIGL